ncbi:uncharacterized protein B0I36DRAFT_114838 [Microdochium trichocladiopsis]|uniref:Diaminohydroxyphosphoribosylamino-pyrimidine deaminase n=1 Tax=Microdochium trichocladiopsis TaxID=1682393 RepID=A0A9P8Y632_9PEZI|nr:uncharacterized protein B0I36DRAFT_114838 [Microdochium trichocladiopsis]KAH7030850.1 hypothetical protein B0I36DRAFT_114838 [Microdochium trichocladiopsis]
MALNELFNRLGAEIEDPEEETFLLFSREIPSQNLGFVDAHATNIDLSIAGKEYVITQSPTVLTSNREGGTTGAVVWKITPLVAEYLAAPDNILRLPGLLSPSSIVIELGCGVSGLIGLVVGPTVQRYVLTDQSYVARFVEKNLSENEAAVRPKGQKKRNAKLPALRQPENVVFKALDWELDEVTPALTGLVHAKSFDLVIACDCIYNEALIEPLVKACVDVCKLRASDDDRGASSSEDSSSASPTLCLVGQQLRDPEIFEAWMKEFHKYFRTWQIPDAALSPSLRSSPGFVLHCGVLRESSHE